MVLPDYNGRRIHALEEDITQVESMPSAEAPSMSKNKSNVQASIYHETLLAPY